MKTLARMLEDGQGKPIARTVFVADGCWSRLRGMIGRTPLAPGEALWILPCSQVHTHFMRTPIGVAFLDRDLRVLRVIDSLSPWRISPWVRGAASVLEFSARSMPEMISGQQLHWRD